MAPSKTRRISRLGVGMIASILSLNFSIPAVAADDATSATVNTSAYGPLVVADAHSYRHCHNQLKRTYCHKADRLPHNSPPNTDTPHRTASENGAQRDCQLDPERCANNLLARKR